MHPPFSIATVSLGTNVHHDLPTKLRVASQLGYDAVEIFIPDFEAFVREVSVGHHRDVLPDSDLVDVNTALDLDIACSTAIRRLCDQLDLAISCYQPFRDFENFGGGGGPSSSSSTLSPRLRLALERAERHIRIMPAMGTDLLLVCSNFLPYDPVTTAGYTWSQYRDDLVVAFSELGKIAARYGVRIGYEPLAWGTVVNRWEQVWDVVEKVDMPNVGVILDSFNCLGRQWADPSMPNGRVPLPDSVLDDNLLTLSQTIPVSKIFLYQLADAAMPFSPIPSYHTFPARMAWSRRTRLFPEEQDGYLPVDKFTRTLVNMGYTGVWSLEVFNASLDGKSPHTVVEHGHRGMVGLMRHWNRCRGDGVDVTVTHRPAALEVTTGQMTPSASPPSKRQAMEDDVLRDEVAI